MHDLYELWQKVDYYFDLKDLTDAIGYLATIDVNSKKFYANSR